MATDWRTTWKPRKKIFFNLKLGETYECFEEKSGEILQGKVTDIGEAHARLTFPNGTFVLLTISSAVSRCNQRLTFY